MNRLETLGIKPYVPPPVPWFKGRKSCYGANDIKMISVCCKKRYFASRASLTNMGAVQGYFCCPHCGWKSVFVDLKENKEWYDGGYDVQQDSSRSM